MQLEIDFYTCSLLFILISKKEVNYDIGFNLMKWVYTDTIESSHKSNEDFYLEMMKQAGHFNLKELKLK